MDSMKRSGVLSWAVLAVLVSCLHMIPVAESLQNCSIYSAIYTFGDSLSDVGNSIAAFPDRYAHAEVLPNGYIFPEHAADRLCDGKLLTDFMGKCSNFDGHCIQIFLYHTFSSCDKSTKLFSVWA